MKDHQIAQLVSKIADDLHLAIPDLPQYVRATVSRSVGEFMGDMEDAETIQQREGERRVKVDLQEL